MKRISNDLLKIISSLFFLFALTYVVLVISITLKIRNDHKRNINSLRQFVIMEKNELEKSKNSDYNFKYFMNDLSEDTSDFNDIYLNFKLDNKIILENNKINFSFSKYPNLIYKDGNFFILNIPFHINRFNSDITIQIVSDYSADSKLMKMISFILFIFFIIIIILTFIVLHNFHSKIKKQVMFIENNTNNIDMYNMNKKLDSSNLYKEFSGVIESYNQMLDRVKLQTENEIEFVSSASHELKTPLFIIGGYINLIETVGINNKSILDESINSIKSELKEVSTLIEKLIFLVKKDRSNLTTDSFGINEITQEIIEEIDIVYNFSNFSIIGCPFNVVTDRKLFKQLLRNVIENAVKYGSEKEIEIIFSENFENKTKKVVIKDNGIGMNNLEIENSFKKFFRSEKSRNKKYGGHGLGLSIVKTIAELLDIKLEITSKKGVGTSFSIIIYK